MGAYQPLIFIISAPSGTGKGTVVKKLLELVPNLERLVTATTRAKRNGEINGESYFFLSEPEFLERIDNDGFVEHNQIYGNYYGTLKDTVLHSIQRGRESGTDFLLEIDVDGKRNFSSKIEHSISIFLLPPSTDELKRRIMGRKSETSTQLKKRLDRAEEEISRKHEFDHMVVNDNLETAVKELQLIIEKERNRSRNRARSD